jgi:phytoene synthase
MSKERTIFKRGSDSFFLSSLLFSRKTRQDVFDLYSFLRVADDYVDRIIPDIENFQELRIMYSSAVADPHFDTRKHKSDSINLRVTKNILRLSHKHNFDPVWIEAFFDSMQADLNEKIYKTWGDTRGYMYGSAEVVGLMMSRLMGADPEADDYARLQGRALQLINFIRDIGEDNRLGRQYFPQEELKKFNLADLSQKTAQAQPEDFEDFIKAQIERHKEWQTEAGNGYKFIPKRMRVALLTAVKAQQRTSRQIARNPLLVLTNSV